MNFFESSFLERIPRAEKVFSFRFQRPEGFEFGEGQFAQIVFDPDNPGNKEMNKYLSFSAMPDKPFFEFTKKISSSLFSKKLTSLSPGDEIKLKGPLGQKIVIEEGANVSFIVGGIGITPVMSVLGSWAQKGLSANIILLYGNKNDEEIVFKNELEQIAQGSEALKIVHVLSEGGQPKEGLRQGLIDETVIREEIPDFSQRRVYLYGPPGMVVAIQDCCLDLGLSKEQLYVEKFIGY